MFLVLHRLVTLALLSLQLVVLAVGALPEKEACCCVARGKACKCKSHAGKHAEKKKAPGPCVSKQSPGCGTPTEVTFSPLTWVSLPEPEAVPGPSRLCLELTWVTPTVSARVPTEVRRPPPRHVS